MKERPILMNAFSVQAILEGRKTQTRRVVKGPGHWWHIDRFLGDWGLSNPPYQYDGTGWTDGSSLPWNWQGRKPPKVGDWLWEVQCDVDDSATYRVRQPPFVGDHLWVRETWATPGNFDDIKPSDLPATHFDSSLLVYRASEPHGDAYYKWRPSIFMPRWASRTLLEVKSVRVERVQDITPDDCEAEGITGTSLGARTFTGSAPNNEYQNGDGLTYGEPRDAFSALWDSIHGKRGYGWDLNPWVWVVEFERIGQCQESNPLP